jgi:hypothetical protein
MRKTSVIAIALTCVGLASVPDAAEARGVAGNASAMWWISNYQNCFQEYYGETRSVSGTDTDNTCTDGRNLANIAIITPLPVDNSATHTVTWSTDGGNRAFGTITCWAQSFERDITYYSSTHMTTNPNGTRFQDMSATVFVDTLGNLESVCALSKRNQGLVTVSYDP